MRERTLTTLGDDLVAHLAPGRTIADNPTTAFCAGLMPTTCLAGRIEHVRQHEPHRGATRGATTPRGAFRRQTPALVIGALATTGSSLIVMGTWAGLAQGRFAGSTTNEGSLFSVAEVDVRLGTATAGSAATMLLLDVENLVPGVLVDRCVATTYRGSIDDVDIRLSGQSDGGSGLERYLDVTVQTGEGADPNCDDFVPATALFAGRLDTLWTEHGSFDDGLTVLTGADDGDRTTVRIAITLASDDAAQGRDTGFWFLFEARP